MALHKLRGAGFHFVALDVNLRTRINDGATKRYGLCVMEEAKIVPAGDLRNITMIHGLEMAIGKRSIELGQSWDFASVGII